MMPQHVGRIRRTHEDGFTLIELLVVVIIVGLLAAIAVPVYLDQRRKAFDSMLRADVRSMALAQETWLTDHPNDPGTVDANALADAGFKKSSASIRIMVVLDPVRRGYCIAAYHPGSSALTSNTYLVFDSLAGGLLNGGRLYPWPGPAPSGALACLARQEGGTWTSL